MCKCGNTECSGFYLLHPKEMNQVPEIEKREREKAPNCTFTWLDNVDGYVTFKELHVIGGVIDA